MKNSQIREFGRFLSVGVANALVGLSVIYLAKWYFRADNFTANAIGYSVGLLVSFILNSRWTFAYLGPRLPAMAKFLLVALVAYGMNLLTVMTAIHFMGLNDYLAQALGIPPYTVTSYLASKYLVFHTKPKLKKWHGQ